MAAIAVLCLWLTHDLKVTNISKRQAVAEFLVEKANNFVRGNTGGYKFDYMIPFIAALFTTSVFSNLISLLGLRSPTADLSTEAAWAVVVFIMITAKKIMQANTKTTDSKQKKLKKVFNWVLKHPYKRYRTLKSVQSKKGWEITFANDVYKKGQGCCVSEASAFAFLAHECGYKNVYICDDTGHAWTEINGRVYDTLFAEAKNYNKYYNSSYGTAGLHRVGKLKI